MSEGPKPLHGRRLVAASIAVPASAFMVVLDTSIANVSVPSIAGDLGVSPASGTWVITSYAVADAIVVPLTGWLALRLGTIRLFLGALIGFVLMSFACGMSSSLEALVGFRILQGMAGAPLLALTQALLYTMYPRERIMVGQAIFAMTALSAPLLGPILGGWIADRWSWEWIFLINVPVGLAAATITWRVLRSQEATPRKVPVDVVGLVLLIVAVGSLQLMLDKGRELDWFGSPLIVGLAATAVVGFAFFIAWELTDRDPIVDLRLFTNRNFSVAVVMLSLTYGVFFGAIVLIPLWLQQFHGYSPFAAGWATAPSGLLVVLLAPVAARYATTVDTRYFLTVALLILIVTFAMRLTWTPDVDMATVMWSQLIQGAGSALFFLPLSQISLGSVRPEQIAMGAGLQNFVRTASGAFAASLSLTVWDHQTIRHHADLSAHVSVYAPATRDWLVQAQQLGIDGTAALALLESQMMQQAALSGLLDYFAFCIPAFVLLLGVTWWLRPIHAPAASPTSTARASR